MKTVGRWRPLAHQIVWRSILVCCALSAVLPSLVTVQQALATSPLNATDELGQSDINGDPIWDRNDDDNHREPQSGGFGWMSGIALDRVHHKFYVANENQNEVVVYNLDNSNEFADRVPDYLLSQSGWGFGSTAGTTQNALKLPNGLALDVTGQRLFVADRGNNRVMVYDVSSLSMNMNASKVLGQANFTSSTAATSQSGLDAPQAVAYDPTRNYLYVADDGVGRVLVYDVASITNGENAVNVIGKANFTSTLACAITQTNLCRAYAVAYDDAGQRLFVSDYGNSRVLVYNVASISNGMAASNILGQPNYTTSGNAPVTASNTGFPDQLEYDATNSRLIVSDFTRVMFFDVASITNNEPAVHEVGLSSLTDQGLGPPIVDKSHMYYSMGTAFNPDNNKLYVVDRQSWRILVFDIASITDGEDAVDVLGQTNGDGSPNFYSNGDYNYNPNSAGLSFPSSTTIDTVHHRLFVANAFDNSILEYDLDANNNVIDKLADHVLGQANMWSAGSGLTQNGSHWPWALAYDSNHNWLYSVEYWNHRIMVYDVAGISDGENALYVLGQADFTHNTEAATATTVNSPNDVAYDNIHQRLFVADSGNWRVLVFNMSGTVSNGMAASYVIGHTDLTTLDWIDDDASMDDPYALAYDPTHNRLFVGDDSDNRIMVFNLDNLANGMHASYVIGQPDFLTYDTAGSAGQNTLPWTQALDYDVNTGQLWVSDRDNRVVMFDTNNLVNGMPATAVLGQADFSGDIYGLSQSQFGFAYDLVVDPTNYRLYIASDANRLTWYDLPQITTANLPDVTVGNSYSQPLTATGLQGTSTFSLLSGALPPGMSLQANGTVTGTPTAAGTYNFTARITDDNGSAGLLYSNRVLSLTVADILQAPSSGGGGNQQSNNEPSDQTATTANEPILLNNDTMYTEPEGSVQTLTTGDTVTFVLPGADASAPDVEHHTVTVNEVTDTYADVTVASDPQSFRLYVGQSKDVDVDRNGTNDLNVKLLGITNKQAQLAFHQLSAQLPAVPTPTTPVAQNVNDTTATPTATSSEVPWLPIIGGGAVVLLGVGLVVWRLRKR